MGYDSGESELMHISKVLGHLEYSAESRRALEGEAIADLNYWRARVRDVLAKPHLPIHIEKQAKALLARIDRLETDTPGTPSRAGQTSRSSPR